MTVAAHRMRTEITILFNIDLFIDPPLIDLFVE
jgi:hypothetical protein